MAAAFSALLFLQLILVVFSDFDSLNFQRIKYSTVSQAWLCLDPEGAVSLSRVKHRPRILRLNHRVAPHVFPCIDGICMPLGHSIFCILHLMSNFLALLFSARKDLSAGGHAFLLCWVVRLAPLHLVRHVGSPRCGIANESLAEQHNQKLLLRLHGGRNNRHNNVGKPFSPAPCALCFVSKTEFPLLL